MKARNTSEICVTLQRGQAELRCTALKYVNLTKHLLIVYANFKQKYRLE